ncbi:Protein of unknown function [Gryllus bimaculatus]|nr:Protein of unknown function [Gryllus bimaculatus]
MSKKAFTPTAALHCNTPPQPHQKLLRKESQFHQNVHFQTHVQPWFTHVFNVTFTKYRSIGIPPPRTKISGLLGVKISSALIIISLQGRKIKKMCVAANVSVDSPGGSRRRGRIPLGKTPRPGRGLACALCGCCRSALLANRHRAFHKPLELLRGGPRRALTPLSTVAATGLVPLEGARAHAEEGQALMAQNCDKQGLLGVLSRDTRLDSAAAARVSCGCLVLPADFLDGGAVRGGDER